MNYGWNQLRSMRPSHYRRADRWVGIVCLLAGIAGFLAPWGGV